MKKINLKKGQITLRITIFLLCTTLSCVMFMQFKTASETNLTDIQNMNEDELKKEIISWQNKYSQVEKQLSETNAKIKEYEVTLAGGEKNSSVLNKEQSDSALLAGITDVYGQGVIVTLEDNLEQQITSRYLLNLVNELKYSGAEAISINGYRLTNFTDIVDVNFVVMMEGIKLSSPYEVKAIGNLKYLSSTLNAKDGFIETYKETGVTISMIEKEKIQIPKYNKELKLKYSAASY